MIPVEVAEQSQGTCQRRAWNREHDWCWTHDDVWTFGRPYCNQMAEYVGLASRAIEAYRENIRQVIREAGLAHNYDDAYNAAITAVLDKINGEDK